MLSFIFDLAILAILGWLGYGAYKGYQDNGNSISPLDNFVAAVIARVSLKK